MSFETLLNKLNGQWCGKCHLWVNPNDAGQTSKSRANIHATLNGKFLQISCTWEFYQKEQQGLMLLGYNPKKKLVFANWMDSWHQSSEFMMCEGSTSEDQINMKGSYSVSEGPTWGWKTKIIVESDEKFVLEMYNVTPAGDGMFAVNVEFTKS